LFVKCTSYLSLVNFKPFWAINRHSSNASSSDVYFHIHHFHSLNSTPREENFKQMHVWKASTWTLLSEFHNARHFLEFMLNFKAPFSKGFSIWGLRASCTMPINPTTLIKLKEGQEKLKEAKKIALICRKATNVPLELVRHSSASTSDFVTLLQQDVMGNFADGHHLSQASEIIFPTRPTMPYLGFIWWVNFSPQNKVPKCSPVLGSLHSLGHNF